MTAPRMRKEKDSMGELEVPASAYYGATTQRALLNFPISGLRFGRSFIRAIGQIKQAAAEVNKDLGQLEAKLAEAIVAASQKVIDGKHDVDFPIDIYQTGSGTSTNMNANEVIANVANEALGSPLGSRQPVHPNDHVNRGQSSNDVIPTAIQLAAAVTIQQELLPAMQELEESLRKKSKEFWESIKTGRTHLQDATPIRLGQEFLGFAGQLEYGRQRASKALAELCVLPLGGTAVGTGIGMHPEFASQVIAKLRQRTSLELSETKNHFQAQATIDAIVEASGSLKTIAVSLMKIGNDIRFMGCGPRAGIGELEIPAVQPGSSIMPGKVNPVIIESMTMVCAQVIGNDATVTIAGQAGSLLELNVMMPVAAHNLLQSVELLAASCRNMARQCVNGLKATPKGPEMVEKGLAICTALAPVIGYDAAAAIAYKAAKSGETVKQVALRETKRSAAELDKVLDPSTMVEPGANVGGGGG
ncbi:MAG TPA: class II fumarate hydratase [Candidatus Krumholzibacteria bacterium]|jgi:fumarate hydratase, class II|nr:class II fumarate hydratase [Candidatus Krumholzibacteria bacterium]